MYETDYSMSDKDVRLSLPVTKVDIERRTVHGFATLDNLDKQDDIIPMEASVKAFEKFRGNIREMHQPLAVGRMVGFKPETLYDRESGKMHKGVFVSAYISRGAQDTWEKVLDGTLSGFSIGGKLKETRNVYDEEMDKVVRVVDDYEMVELSLVDTPANPLANVTLVQKVDGVMEGLDIKGDLETIYMCKEDNVVKVSEENGMQCPVCDNAMANIGFVESNDTEKSGIIKGMVSKFLGNTTVKEAKEMAEQNETEVVEKSEADAPAEEVEAVVEKADDVEATEEPVADAVEEAEEEVVEAPAEEVAKADNQSDAVNELLIKSLNTVVETLESLTARLEGVEKSVTGRLDAVESTVNKTTENVEEFGKRVDKVEDTTAFRKSGDLGEVAQERVEKTQSLWGGTFLTVSDL